MQLSSFADFSDHHDLDPMDDSSSDSSDDEDVKPPPPNLNRSYSGYPRNPKPLLSSSASATVHLLAQRLSEVTSIPLARCIETISRFPPEELSAINPNAPIPSQFLPGPAQQQAAPAHHQHQHQPKAAATVARSENARGTVGRRTAAKKTIAVPSPVVVLEDPLKKGETRQQRPHDPNRPNFSYSALIGQAILSVPEKRLRLAEIYEYVTDNCASRVLKSQLQALTLLATRRRILQEERVRLAELDPPQPLAPARLQKGPGRRYAGQEGLLLDHHPRRGVALRRRRLDEDGHQGWCWAGAPRRPHEEHLGTAQGRPRAQGEHRLAE